MATGRFDVGALFGKAVMFTTCMFHDIQSVDLVYERLLELIGVCASQVACDASVAGRRYFSHRGFASVAEGVGGEGRGSGGIGVRWDDISFSFALASSPLDLIFGLFMPKAARRFVVRGGRWQETTSSPQQPAIPWC